ncbi:uncharacterized protein LOC103181728 [Callorhinchus milii]|uniref:uncharacterized protein LOC103181728 n=1 Tax=Callorhinchus milii TaxID=7868 RepID=UPI0004572A72|nr:uncharacterized protein LOC103181728 [Callorhinchus milii]|eukprot:gi/632961113/ref/XP_007896577.1/ PREDICTED: uncharacterized protein LOC103181728 [Callorhinchus milii]
MATVGEGLSLSQSVPESGPLTGRPEAEVNKRRGRGRPTLSPDTRKKRRLEHTRHTNKIMSALMSASSKHQTTANASLMQKTETHLSKTNESLKATEDCESEASSSQASSVAEDDDDFEDETLSNITAEDDVFCADLSDTVTTESIEEESISFEDNTMPGMDILERKKCIADIDIIMDLLKMIHGNDCKSKGCTKKLTYHCRMIGTALVAHWTCSNRHIGGKFCTAPCFKGCISSNLQLAASVLISGNNYRKTALLFKFMRLGCISSSNFYKIQRLYGAPAVVQHWKTMQEKLFKKCDGENVVLCGDGTNDTAGRSAQYCTYTFRHHTRKHILNVDVVDVSEVGGKSTNMEKLGFQRSLDYLRTKLNVIEVTTDSNPQIATLMKKEKYSGIFHSHDIWLGGKHIQKKVIKAAQKKGNDVLMMWAEPMRNHFWYCAKSCNGNEVLLAERWASLLHHVVNEHEWVVPNSAGETTCNHEPIQEEEHNQAKSWIQHSSPPLKILRQIILDRNFLRNISRFKYFRHNNHMESFHNYLQMYASGRHSYDYLSYKLRNYIAAIDYNHHLHRPQAKNMDGTPMFRARYSKRTKSWHTEAVKEDKKYDYVPNLMENILFNKLQSERYMSQI